ncbi:unnamed protein product [Microthlaspi erraticum]|uniref:Uncharacterized protein n=1 Tax=Microthlaspi erraticum TaxID=1685480 RepID=A0A6D2J042_9BRAS|nr:unnamed protein product [Microthlaspi erraticum]
MPGGTIVREFRPILLRRARMLLCRGVVRWAVGRPDEIMCRDRLVLVLWSAGADECFVLPGCHAAARWERSVFDYRLMPIRFA